MEVNDVRLNPTTIDNIAILHHSAFIRLYRDTHKKFPLWAQALLKKSRGIRGFSRFSTLDCTDTVPLRAA